MKKKTWTRVLPLVLCLVMIAAAMSGCSNDWVGESQTAYPGAEAPRGEDGAMPNPAPSEPEYDSGRAGGVSDKSRDPIAGNAGSVAGGGNISAEKLIRNVYLRGETRAFEDALTGIKTTVESMGGYIESASEYGKKPEAYGDSGRSANIVARIPAEKLDSFVSATSGLIDIISQSSNVTNVTTQYYDYEARKKTYEIQLQRLESILTEASELADILALETEIARVRYELESIETTLRNLDNQIGYSTVSIEFYELTQFERPQATEQSLGERISTAFAQSLKNAGIWLQDTIVWISGNIFGLIILAAVVVLVLRLVSRYNKKHGYVSQRTRRNKNKKVQPAVEQRTEAQPQAEKGPEDDAANKS
ncbi:MAG: DUF4349 domain-containing protein [Christensenellales bacterium]|jgi:hypothetical protein